MDVNDRSIRLDVFPSAVALNDPSPPTAATDSSNASFADTLQQAQSSTATDPPPPAQAPKSAGRLKDAPNSQPDQPSIVPQDQHAAAALAQEPEAPASPSATPRSPT